MNLIYFWPIMFFLLVLFIFGTIVGSFLNVVILRFNTGKSIIADRSRCFSCGKKLEWYNLVPILSWLFQMGKCSKCKTKISAQYPLVEFFTGLVFVLTFTNAYYFSPIGGFILPQILVAIIFCLLIVIFVYDLHHKIIPDQFSFALAGTALALQLLTSNWHNFFTPIQILNLLAGPLLYFGVYLIWKISKGTWIGLGDAKLLLGIGWWLGFVLSFSAFILAVWIGALFSFGLMLISKLKNGSRPITMKTEIPLGPFLIFGAGLIYFCPVDILSLSLLLDLWF